MTDQDLYRLIGKRLRARRRLLELTQTEVARACDTTFQQIHKHETGACVLSVGRLIRLAQVLRAPVTSFLEPHTDRALDQLQRDNRAASS